VSNGTSAPIKLVLDTNVVIDWLVFDDPFMNPLRHGVRDGRIVVLTHPPAIDELKRVLAYPQLKLNSTRQHEIFACYLAETTIVAMPEGFSPTQLMMPGGFPRCRDRDDQKFLELAQRGAADWLLTRDKALLRVRKAVRFAIATFREPSIARRCPRIALRFMRATGKRRV